MNHPFWGTSVYPRDKKYGVFTHIWLIFRANVGTYSIHGAYGLWKPPSITLVTEVPLPLRVELHSSQAVEGLNTERMVETLTQHNAKVEFERNQSSQLVAR